VLGNGLTGAFCEVKCNTDLTGGAYRYDRWPLTAQVFGDEMLKLVVTPIQPPLSRRHQGPFNNKRTEPPLQISAKRKKIRERQKKEDSRETESQVVLLLLGR
jgi:hypothetical protein